MLRNKNIECKISICSQGIIISLLDATDPKKKQKIYVFGYQCGDQVYENKNFTSGKSEIIFKGQRRAPSW